MGKIKYLVGIENEYEGPLDLKSAGFDVKELKKYVSKILDILLEIPEVSNRACFFGLEFNKLSFDILLVDDENIHKINKDFREKDRATDVITFALFADDDFKPVLDGEINLGEILISVDTAYAQSKDVENAMSGRAGFKNEILTLICHGVLHLFGFDHQTEEDYNFITSIQNRVISAL